MAVSQHAAIDSPFTSSCFLQALELGSRLSGGNLQHSLFYTFHTATDPAILPFLLQALELGSRLSGGNLNTLKDWQRAGIVVAVAVAAFLGYRSYTSVSGARLCCSFLCGAFHIWCSKVAAQPPTRLCVGCMFVPPQGFSSSPPLCAMQSRSATAGAPRRWLSWRPLKRTSEAHPQRWPGSTSQNCFAGTFLFGPASRRRSPACRLTRPRSCSRHQLSTAPPLEQPARFAPGLPCLRPAGRLAACVLCRRSLQ